MIVRLKDVLRTLIPALPTRFNSMIVRLKVLFQKEFETLLKQFQFYDSPIKSEYENHIKMFVNTVSIL